MKIINSFLLMCSCLLFVSCCCGSNDEGVTANDPSLPIWRLKYNIKYNGDLGSYNELSNYYLDCGTEAELYKWAKIMADKYDLDEAYLDVFYSLYYKQEIETTDEFSLDLLNKSDRDIAIKYLSVSANRGSYTAKRKLGRYYMEGKYLAKDTILGERLIFEADSIVYGK
jgi:hypothetical protein